MDPELLSFAKKLSTLYNDFHTNKEEQLKIYHSAKNCFALTMENFKKHVETAIIEGKNEIIYDISLTGINSIQECKNDQWMDNYKRMINIPLSENIYHDIIGNPLNVKCHQSENPMTYKGIHYIIPDDCMLFRLEKHRPDDKSNHLYVSRLIICDKYRKIYHFKEDDSYRVNNDY
jgi:hypothetical protein